MAFPVPRPVTPEEYLARERAAQARSEYLNGQVFAMSGGTEEHVRIAGNLHVALRERPRARPCRVYQADMRVKCEATGLYNYPDVTVAGGERRCEDERRDTLLNPLLVVRVLPAPTEACAGILFRPAGPPPAP